MIGSVMFLGGFFTSLLAFYGRNAPLLMLAVILFAFCWVGHERVHKAFRIIPIVLLSIFAIISEKQAYLLVNIQNNAFLCTICILMVIFLLVSTIPSSITQGIIRNHSK